MTTPIHRTPLTRANSRKIAGEEVTRGSHASDGVEEIKQHPVWKRLVVHHPGSYTPLQNMVAIAAAVVA